VTDLASVMRARQLDARTAPPHDVTSTASTASPETTVSVSAYSLADAAQVGFALGLLTGLGLGLIVVTLAGVLS
jgi:ABC-type nitrate/sulfonate/bicarbonate transport system permease component